MKHFPLFLLLVLFVSCKKESIRPELIRHFDLTSVETGNSYDITVQLPEEYTGTGTSYATMYVLDAKQDDAFVAVTSNKLSKAYNTQNVVVVGIRCKNANTRDADYTPTRTAFGKGCSEAFLQFIKNKLIPRMQSDYNVDTLRSRRVIIGHSFGGLFGAYAFTKHNEVFGQYLLLSPSLFYDNSIILKYEQQKREAIKSKKQLVFIGLGSLENGLLPSSDLLYQRLVKFYPNTTSVFELIPGRGHMSSKDIDIENAISFYFKNR